MDPPGERRSTATFNSYYSMAIYIFIPPELGSYLRAVCPISVLMLSPHPKFSWWESRQQPRASFSSVYILYSRWISPLNSPRLLMVHNPLSIVSDRRQWNSFRVNHTTNDSSRSTGAITTRVSSFSNRDDSWTPPPNSLGSERAVASV